ncbi:MAG: sigma-70 family RNA polymerase sigma factor [Pseudomonadota bacterium]
MSPRNLPVSPAVPASPALQNVDDATLVQMVQAGHVHAAKWLHDRFAADINRVVYRILGGDADHEDMVHEIFMTVWASIAAGKVSEPAAVRSWVFSVATNMLYKELRRRYVRRRFLRRHHSAPEGVSGIRDEAARELLLAVHRVLAEMQPAHGLIFGLRYLDRRPLADLASLCGCSTATAKRRLKKAERAFIQLARRHGSHPALMSLVANHQKGQG